MDIKTKFSLKKVCGEGKESREYQFIADAGVPLGEAYDACHEFLAKIVELADQAAKRAKKDDKAESDKK